MTRNRLTAEMIDHITIRATTVTYHHTSWEYKPEGMTAAQMNMHYVVAVTALEGEIFIDQFTEQKAADPRIIEYTRKVEVIADPELDKLGPEFRHAVIAQLKTREGQILQERVDTAKGSARNPMSTDEVIEKYETLAGKVLPPKRVAELKEMVFHLERVGNVQELARLLGAAPEA